MLGHSIQRHMDAYAKSPSRAKSFDSARLGSTRLLCTLILDIRHSDFLEVGKKTAIHNNGLFCFFLIISSLLSINIVSVSANGVECCLSYLSDCVCVCVCRSVCPKNVLYPDAVWDGEWGRSRDRCIRWSGDRQRGKGVLGVNLRRPTVTNEERCALPK